MLGFTCIYRLQVNLEFENQPQQKKKLFDKTYKFCFLYLKILKLKTFSFHMVLFFVHCGQQFAHV